MSQPAVSRHLKVLEQAGLISRRRRATARLSHLEAAPLREATAWLAGYQAYWDHSYELLMQWLGPRGQPMTVERLEARDGGRWRYIHHDADGQPYGFHGVFHGTPSPDGIVRTVEFEGAPGHVSLETLTFKTLTFEEQGATTLLRQSAVLQAEKTRLSGASDGRRRAPSG